MNNKGYALPAVFIFLLVISILATVAYDNAYRDIKETDQEIKQEDSLYYAEAGFNRYLYFLNENPKYYNTSDSTDMENQTAIPFKDGFYNLEITPPTMDNPYVTIVSTGWPSGKENESRTIEVNIRRRQFTNFIYGTGEETLPDGTPVWWTDDDVVNGPLHTNGTLNIDGDPTFNGEVSYSRNLNIRSGSNPTYTAGEPFKRNPLEFPNNNSELKTWAEAPGGYYYQGRTCILINGDRLLIRNQDNPIEDRPLPSNGVIYVDNLNNEMDKWDLDSGNIFLSGELNGSLTIAAQNTIYITAHDPTNWSNLDTTGGITYANPTLDENNDDLLGLVSQRNIEILHHGWPRYTYWTDHWSESNDVSVDDITIEAAIFALDGSFSFEDHDEGGSKGTITVNGPIVQKDRGPVATFSSYYGYNISGYDTKDYSHDPRMAFDTPPHFLEPANAGWEVLNWREIN